MERRSPVFVSKLLSLMLRHRPDEFGVEVDAYGFANLAEVVEALQERDESITQEDVEAVVYEGEKKRFEIVEGRIRARYGHSIAVELGTDPVEPPEFLYKGVDRRDVNAVLREGLEPGDRQYVHLSFEADVAAQLGGGRRAPGIVIRVSALIAHRAGVPFYDCGPTMLTPRVPPEYVSVDESTPYEPPPAREVLAGPVSPGAPVRESDRPKTFGRGRRFSNKR